METQENFDAWKYVQKLVGRALPSLPSGEQRQFGEVTYDGSWGDSVIHLSRKGLGCVGIIHFDDTGNRDADHLEEIGYLDHWNKVVLRPEMIYSEDNALTRPTVSYKWLSGNSEPNLKGKLAFVRLTSGKGAVRGYDISNNRVVYEDGKIGLANLPLTLEGLNKISIPRYKFEASLDRTIDYDQEAREIIAKSGLEDFVDAVCPSEIPVFESDLQNSAVAHKMYVPVCLIA